MSRREGPGQGRRPHCSHCASRIRKRCQAPPEPILETDPYAWSYAEIGEAFHMPSTSEGARQMRRQFEQCIVDTLAYYRGRLEVFEAELERRDREALRAKLKLIQGGKS
jgi:hypothetical protein